MLRTKHNVSIKTARIAWNNKSGFILVLVQTVLWLVLLVYCLKKGLIHIYIVDQRNTSGEGALSVGIQIDATTAISDPASPNVDATAGTSPTSEDDLFTHLYLVHKPKMK